MNIFFKAPKNIKTYAVVNLLLLLLLATLFPLLPPIIVLLVAVLYLLLYIGLLLKSAHIKDASQDWLPLTNLEARSFHFWRHFALPFIQAICLIASLYYIKIPLINYILVFIQGLLAFYTFLNLEAFFNRSPQIEIHTHFIYDVLSLATVFYCNYAIFATGEYFALPEFIVAISIILFMGVFVLAETIRYKSQRNELIALIFAGIFCALLLIKMAFALSNLRIIIMLGLGAYIFLNLLHHRRESALRFRLVMFEYLLIIAMAAIILVQVIP